MEDEIRQLMHEAAPQPSDPALFRLELNSKLAAVEQIKAYRDREYRRSRHTLRIVFAAGILVGAALAILIILHPFDMPDIAGIFSAIKPEATDDNYLTYVLILLGILATAGAIVLPLTISRRMSPFSSWKNHFVSEV